jgi:hypothetical protein
MTALVVIVSLGWILVMFASAAFVAVWTLIRLLRGFVRIYLAITEPETRARKKGAPDLNPHQWKRAGQW